MLPSTVLGKKHKHSKLAGIDDSVQLEQDCRTNSGAFSSSSNGDLLSEPARKNNTDIEVLTDYDNEQE